MNSCGGVRTVGRKKTTEPSRKIFPIVEVYPRPLTSKNGGRQRCRKI